MIAAPALIYGGRFFYQSAWNALKHGRTNMDVPIALAITLSYAVSLWETIHHGEHAWFDATVSLLFFLLIGRTLDHIMRDKARSAIAGLARLSPRGATVIDADGVRDYRPLADIEPGMSIAIAAGDRVAVDAVVVCGSSDLDMSIVNGESAPRRVVAGDSLQAGTLNLTGSLVARVTASAKDSFLSEVIGLMEAAEGGRARYRRIADRAASYYSPVVHLLALVTFLGWGIFGGDWKQAMLIAIAVLIITCPCALGLAVPVVQVVAAGRLFRRGIMVKEGSAMERLSEIDTVLFDKTGTLTVGKPRLVETADVKPAIMAIAAGLAAHSRHPLSKALHAAYNGALPAYEAVRKFRGRVSRPRRKPALTGSAIAVSPARMRHGSTMAMRGRKWCCLSTAGIWRASASRTIRARVLLRHCAACLCGALRRKSSQVTGPPPSVRWRSGWGSATGARTCRRRTRRRAVPRLPARGTGC